MSGQGVLKLGHHQGLKPRRRQDLNLVGPGEQVPRQLQHAAGPKADQHGSVRLFGDFLVGMEAPAQGIGRPVRLRFVLKDADLFALQFR